MFEVRKLLIYFTSHKNYWKRYRDCVSDDYFHPYFLDLEERVKQNHYNSFDKNGIPLRYMNGLEYYNYTTICSYGLANWNMFIKYADEKYLKKFFTVSDFLKKNYETTKNNTIVYRAKGRLCAMSQGEALSVLVRDYSINKEPYVLEMIAGIVASFGYEVEEGGVRAYFKEIDDIWFEERTIFPYKHILNGMIYALIGLYEVRKELADFVSSSNKFFENGIDALEKAMPLFDKKKWSNYWIAENDVNYIASMMYHNLHICQLEYLYEITQKKEFKIYAEKFNKYQKNRFYRIRAGFELLKQKILKVSK